MPEENPSTLSNVLATVGLLLVLIVVLWGLIHLATLLSPWFGSFFTSKPAATLQVQAPTEATSSQPFTLRWSYDTSAKGPFAFVYPCSDSLRFETPVQGSSAIIPCGAAYSLTGTAVSLTPYLSGIAVVHEPLTILFTPSATGGAKVQGSATIAIHPLAPTPVVTKPAPKASQGPADLAVTLISATIDQMGWGTVVFDIANQGTGNSVPYTFQVFIPTQSAYIYYSPAQASLAPSSHIISTLRFTQAISGATSIIIDPSNSVNDPNRANNYAGAQMTAPYGYTPQPYDLPAQAGGYYAQPYVY